MADDQFEELPDLFSTANRVEVPIYPLDVYIVTEAGTAELNRGATRLPAQALEILVLLDGKATVGDLEHRLEPMPAKDVRHLLRILLAARLVRTATVSETDGFDFDRMLAEIDGKPPPSGAALASAGREAHGGASELEKNGYYVSIARAAVKAHAPADGARWSVLVIDDDPDMRALVRQMLEGEGYVAEEAADRTAVLERLRRLPMPDAVLLDVNMPDVNGFEILKVMKAHPKLKVVPVIMVTAEATRDGVMLGLANGADGYITKPFTRAHLISGVRAVLGVA